jgi:PEP-CTERM motif-containing protein
MKKIILTLAVTSLLALTSTRGAITSVLLSFNDNNVDGNNNATTWSSNVGTFNFSIDVSLSFSTDNNNPNMLSGLSYWLETETGAASSITLTSLVYFTITQPTDPGPNKVFNASSGADPGFLASHDSVPNPNTNTVDTGDLGGTFPARGPGTFQVATLNFAVSGLAPGTYHLETTHLLGLTSEATNNSTTPSERDSLIPQAIYTITVVPEPATLSLLGLGALGSLGLTALRARRKG